MASFLPQVYWIGFTVVTGFISLSLIVAWFCRHMDNIDRVKMGWTPIAFPKPLRNVLPFVLPIAIICAICAGRAPENIQRSSFVINDANTSIPPEVAEKIFAKAFDSLPVEAKYRILSGGQK